MKTTTEKFDVIEAFNDKLVNLILTNEDKWKQPWKPKGFPKNLSTGMPYNGINMLYLFLCDYNSRYFLTFKQAVELGGKIKKGAKAEMIIYADYVAKDVKTGKTIKKEYLKNYAPDDVFWNSFYKYHNVFSMDFIEGIEIPEESELDKVFVSPEDCFKACDDIIDGYADKPAFKEGNALDGAYYVPSLDYYTVPPKESFLSLAGYYSVHFHELAHSTGHDKRLKRKSLYAHEHTGPEKKQLAAFEELVAEISTMFLMVHSGMVQYEALGNSMTYLKGWVRNFEHKDKTLIQAAMKASQAFNYMLNESKLSKEISQS